MICWSYATEFHIVLTFNLAISSDMPCWVDVDVES
jgi:hypothetical protein